MKKTMTILLLLAMILSLTACGKQAEAPQAEMPAEFPQADVTPGIPSLHFVGDISGMESKSDVRNICVQYRDDDQEFNAYATLKVQGTSSLAYEKKNYTIQFFKDGGHDKKEKVDLGWGGQSKYCLKANWIDKTQSRNIVSARLAAQVQEKYDVLSDTPNHGLIDGYPIEIYVNGEFHGLYTMNIPKDKWMFNMDDENENHLVYCGESWDAKGIFEALPDKNSWSVEVGEDSPKNMKKLSKLFEFVMNSSDEDFKAHFAEHLDLDATLNYMVMCELGLMYDNLGKNMLLATYDGEVWYPSLYDMDTTWGTHWTGLALENYGAVPVIHGSHRNYLFYRVETLFPQELTQRYFELRQDILTQENIMGLFEDFAAAVPQGSWDKEQARWENAPGYDYDQIREFLEIRIPLVDQYMREMQEKAELRQWAENY